ncbi:MAG: hypothetical protein NC826_03525 [Candidatus Omnitrophica bacterium]|nr:hypothetical protein [Candidatus Omnitrophota bacterium]
MTIKDWGKRDLFSYEKEIKKFIPTGSKVLGNPEDWYALRSSGSRLLLLYYIYTEDFNWNNIDYIIMPLYIDISKKYPHIYNFVKNKCELVTVVGKGAYSYTLLDGFSRFSGYKSAIYKVKR